MVFSGEITLGAIGIIVSVLATGLGGVITVSNFYAKTRSEIDALKSGYADLKTDIAKLETKQETQSGVLQSIHVLVAGVAARQDMQTTMKALPTDIADAVAKLMRAQP